jgi:AcrR family transcriptional regulator
MTAMAQIDDPSEALREGARRYRALALAHPMAYQVMFLRAVPGFEPSLSALGRCTGTFDSLVAAVQRAIDAGQVAGGSPTETAHLIWATIHGFVSLELLGIGFVEDQDGAYEHLCEALLRGLRPDPDGLRPDSP